MKVSVPFFSLFFFLLTTFVGNAQEVPEFTVQIGNFVNPKPADFEQIASMGFLQKHGARGAQKWGRASREMWASRPRLRGRR